MHIEEVAMVIQRLLSSVSRPFDKDQFMSHVGADKENLSFTEVLEVTEQRSVFVLVAEINLPICLVNL